MRYMTEQHKQDIKRIIEASKAQGCSRAQIIARIKMYLEEAGIE